MSLNKTLHLFVFLLLFMGIIYLMIMASVSLALVFLMMFIIGAKKGQFDEDESPAVRILKDNKLKQNHNANGDFSL